MATKDVSSLLKGRSIAVIGASERSRVAGVFKNLQRMGFPKERLFAVNPNRSHVFDFPCYSKVAEIQEPVDLAVIATGRDHVLQAVEQCIEKKIKGALVFADGFAESGEEGRRIQDKITHVCNAHDFLICGPNCMGYIVPAEQLGLWSSELPAPFPTGNISAVFQSSGVLALFLRQVTLRGLGFRIAVATGNQVSVAMEDYLAHVVEDPETKVIILYIEAITRPQDMMDALDRALELGKPVIAMRVGKGDRARRNVVAHTGNLAATGRAWDAILRQKGVTLVGNFDEFTEAIVLFSQLKAARSVSQKGIGLISVSGGDCSFLSDLSERVGVVLPELSPSSRQKIGEYLGKSTLLGNPLDIENLRRQNEQGFNESIDLFIREPSFEIIGCRVTLPAKPTDSVKDDCRRMAECAKAHEKLLIFMSRASEGTSAEWLKYFAGLGTPFLEEYERGLKSIKAWLRYQEVRESVRKRSETTSIGSERIQALKTAIGNYRHKVLPYELGVQLLSLYGIPVAAGGLAKTPEAADAAAAETGFPVALKVASPDVPHKTDIGAVMLNIESREGLRTGFHHVVEVTKRAVPTATVEGVVVQKMIRGVAEAIVGIYTEPGLGPVVMLGLGGVFVEVLRDVSFRRPPFELNLAYEMIDELQSKEILQGVRGRPRADVEGLVNVIWQMSRLAIDFQNEIDQFEINPLIISAAGGGVNATDILAVAK